MLSPVLVCAFRRVSAFQALAGVLRGLTQSRDKPNTSGSVPQAVMALTPEVTFRQAILFFTEADFVTGKMCLLFVSSSDTHHLLPSLCFSSTVGESGMCREESLFAFLQAGAQVLCTVLLIKPGVWSRSLTRILRNLHLAKFSVVGMKHMDLPVPPVVTSLQDAAALEAHCSYLMSGTALVLCLQRPNAVKELIDLLGPEDPALAQALDPCLWRAQFGTSTVQNGFYGSKSYQIAVRDMKLFFPEGLCCANCQTLEEEKV
ncbi:Nucleoside diphosphate kinase 7, partial [Acanthisitta chloris]